MKLLLQRNVENLGEIGEVVNVADGYGRNYLLPNGFAVDLTKDNLHRFEMMKRRLIAMERETIQKFQLLAKELGKSSCTIIDSRQLFFSSGGTPAPGAQSGGEEKLAGIDDSDIPF